MPTETKLRKSVTGTCNVALVSPANAPADGPGSVVNLTLNFEEALKLNLAIEAALHRINRYDRSTRAGKQAGLRLVVYLGKGRINVMEGNVPAKEAS